jgi:hypothetical protein
MQRLQQQQKLNALIAQHRQQQQHLVTSRVQTTNMQQLYPELLQSLQTTNGVPNVDYNKVIQFMTNQVFGQELTNNEKTNNNNKAKSSNIRTQKPSTNKILVS